MKPYPKFEDIQLGDTVPMLRKDKIIWATLVNDEVSIDQRMFGLHCNGELGWELSESTVNVTESYGLTRGWWCSSKDYYGALAKVGNNINLIIEPRLELKVGT